MLGNCKIQSFWIIVADCEPYFVNLNSYLGPTAKVRIVDRKAIFQNSFELLLKISAKYIMSF